MIRVTEDTLSDAGFPVVYWEQEVPTGQSLRSVQQSVELKIAAVVMVFVFAAVWAWSEQFWGAVIAAMIIGGMCLSGDKMFRGGVKVWDIHIPGPEPRDTGEADRRAKATAILGKQYRGLAVDRSRAPMSCCCAWYRAPIRRRWNGATGRRSSAFSLWNSARRMSGSRGSRKLSCGARSQRQTPG